MKSSGRILVVNGDLDSLRPTVRLLRSAGYDVSEAVTGSEGLRLAQDQMPDLLLLDRMLPDISGIEICRHSKADPKLARIAVVILSASAVSSDDQAAALEEGADGYVAGPISDRELLARVRAILRIQASKEALRRSESLYRALASHIPNGSVLLFDQSLRFLVADGTGFSEVGWSKGQVEGKYLHEITTPENNEILEPLYRAALAGTASVAELEVAGRTRWGRIIPVRNAQGEVWAGMVMTQDVTERRQAEDVLRRQHNELAARDRIISAILRTFDLDERFRVALEETMALLGADLGGIYLVEGDAFVLRVCQGLSQELCAQAMSSPLTSVSGHEGIQAWAYAPLILPARRIDGTDLESELLGILALASRRYDAFSKQDIHALQAMGEKLALVLQDARLYERLQRVSQRLVEVQEEERRQIARELHDEIGQFLTGLRFTLETCQRVPVQAAMAKLKEAATLVSDLIARVSALSLDLRPSILDDFGLLPTLTWHFERYTTQTGTEVDFQHQGLDARFPPPVEITAFRIVQEALTNVARHAGVRQAKVECQVERDRLVLRIDDRGVGFDPDAVQTAGRVAGLVGMKERTQLLGGRLQIVSSRGVGTTIAAELPLSSPVRRET